MEKSASGRFVNWNGAEVYTESLNSVIFVISPSSHYLALLAVVLYLAEVTSSNHRYVVPNECGPVFRMSTSYVYRPDPDPSLARTLQRNPVSLYARYARRR